MKKNLFGLKIFAGSLIAITPLIALTACGNQEQKKDEVYTLTGGSTTLDGLQGTSGEDTQKWQAKNSKGEVVQANLSIDPSNENISIQDGKVKWTNAITAGTYTFKIKGEITNDGKTSTFYSNQITLNIIHHYYEMNIDKPINIHLVKQHDTGKYSYTNGSAILSLKDLGVEVRNVTYKISDQDGKYAEFGFKIATVDGKECLTWECPSEMISSEPTFTNITIIPSIGSGEVTEASKTFNINLEITNEPYIELENPIFNLVWEETNAGTLYKNSAVTNHKLSLIGEDGSEIQNVTWDFADGSHEGWTLDNDNDTLSLNEGHFSSLDKEEVKNKVLSVKLKAFTDDNKVITGEIKLTFKEIKCNVTITGDGWSFNEISETPIKTKEINVCGYFVGSFKVEEPGRYSYSIQKLTVKNATGAVKDLVKNVDYQLVEENNIYTIEILKDTSITGDVTIIGQRSGDEYAIDINTLPGLVFPTNMPKPHYHEAYVLTFTKCVTDLKIVSKVWTRQNGSTGSTIDITSHAKAEKNKITIDAGVITGDVSFFIDYVNYVSTIQVCDYSEGTRHASQKLFNDITYNDMYAVQGTNHKITLKHKTDVPKGQKNVICEVGRSNQASSSETNIIKSCTISTTWDGNITITIPGNEITSLLFIYVYQGHVAEEGCVLDDESYPVTMAEDTSLGKRIIGGLGYSSKISFEGVDRVELKNAYFLDDEGAKIQLTIGEDRDILYTYKDKYLRISSSGTWKITANKLFLKFIAY